MTWEQLENALSESSADGCTIRDWQLQRTEACKLSLGIKDTEAGNIHAPLAMAESCNVRYLLIWSDGRLSRGLLERQQDARAEFEQSRAASYDDPDAAHVLGAATFPDVELFDEATARTAGGEVDAIASRLDRSRERLASIDAKTWSGSFSAAQSNSRLRTSAGLDVESAGTSCGWYLSLDGEIGDGFGARRPESEAEFEQRLERLLETRAHFQRDATSKGSGDQAVLLHPRVVESYVLSTLFQNLDGAAVAHDEGAFTRDQFGSDEAALRDDIDCGIDPLQPFLSGSYRFTGFGLPSAACQYVESGRLVQPILDIKYARRLERKPTPVPFGHDTVHFGPRQRLPYDGALQQTDVIVHSVLGVHTQDRVSGDFSLSAPLSLAVSNGQVEGRVRGTISGNLWSLLRDESTQFVEFPGETTAGLRVHCRFDASVGT